MDRAIEAQGRAFRRGRAILPGWLLALALCLLSVAPALAQAGGVTVDDPDRLFGNGSTVREAAERLAGEGADVVVIAIQNAGADALAAQAYLDRRLNELGIAESTDRLRGNQIVFYVAPNPGFNGIYFVGRYRDQLEPVYRTIQQQQMVPRFTTDDFSGGMVAGIDAVRTTLNPPPSPVPWVVGGAAAAGLAGAGAVSALRKRRAAAEALGAARAHMEEARSAAGVAIADIGQRIETAQEKAQYDKLSYTPEDAARVGEAQRRGEELFARAQVAFDAAEEAQIAQAQPTAAHYESLAAKFADARQLAVQAGGAIDEAERMRGVLDSGGTPSTGATRMLE